MKSIELWKANVWTGGALANQPKNRFKRIMEDKNENEVSLFGQSATGEMAVMGVEGDTRHFWNVGNPTDVEIAKKVFDLYLEKKYKPFRMESDGETGEQMTEFDPHAGCILFIPQMQGG